MDIEMADKSTVKKSDQNDRDFFYIRVPNDDESDLSENDDENDGKNQIIDDEKEIDFDALLEQLNIKYAKIRDDISILVDKKNVTKGNWNPEKRVVQIVGKDYLKQYTPNAKCLTPFEALFLLECRSLAIYYLDILLSIEDAYELLLHDNREVKLYKIFSTLSRIGFYVQQIVSKPLEIPKIDIEKEQQSKSIKRTVMDDNDNDQNQIDSKKINTSNNENSNDNYAIITSIQPLKMENIPKLNKMDKELIQHFKSKDGSDEELSPSTNSYLYCVKKAARPANLSQLVRPLYSQKHKPLIPLGSILDTESLFQSIQQQAPLCFDNLGSKCPVSMLNIDFNIYQSQANKKQNHKPLFSVIVVDENQPTPSIEEIYHFRELIIQNGPILFAVLAQFTFNFYSFETLMAKNKFPRLWEQFYHHKGGRR
ncbi:tRNA splicing endonuclease subunit 54 [Dermatophagoides pteronyssinus]|uniref:tRNA splicing endonuclease subunit 54 n=1 Tax=Dermatophagoides pteronyssinus TaxID=6956 RepID=UPI003F679CF8